MKYKKALKLFRKYEVKMEITGWDDRSFRMLHTFVAGDRIVAEGTSVGVIAGKDGVVPPVEVIRKVTERLNNKISK